MAYFGTPSYGGGKGYSKNHYSGPSILESMVAGYRNDSAVYETHSAPELVVEPEKQIIYDKSASGYEKKSDDNYYSKNPKPEDFAPELFLAPDRKNVKFVKATEEIKEMVVKTFELLTGKPLPEFNIAVCSADEMKKHHPNWNPSIRGFAVPSTQSIFCIEAPLDELMITIGHEIGHLLTKSLDNPRDEEAKAFAFSRAWAQVKKEHNIGGLGENIKIPAPAKNDLHDKALEFVNEWVKAGESPVSIFYKLSSGYIRNR
ncbi:hypothetical protein KY316_03285 [Candidatus Woesearchaeota archaeon]|nr:hypothetical protein [Candidatus Woesearchaeota archaeon]